MTPQRKCAIYANLHENTREYEYEDIILRVLLYLSS